MSLKEARIIFKKMRKEGFEKVRIESDLQACKKSNPNRHPMSGWYVVRCLDRNGDPVTIAH